MRAFMVAICVFGLSACVSGARSGGFAGSIDDASASLAIKSRMLRAPYDFSGVDIDVIDGLVLLTGHVPTATDRAEAERIAWSAPKVVDVGNEIVVADGGRSLLGANDQRISATVRTRLATNARVRGATINIETHDGVVYLLGRVRSDAEAREAARTASLVGGVKRVVTYLRSTEGGADHEVDIAPIDDPEVLPPVGDGGDELLGGVY